MRKVLSILIILFIGGFAFAQSAEVVTDILNSDEVTYGQVCYLSAVHQGLISDDADYSEAVQKLYSLGQIPEDAGEYDSVYLANLAYIYVQIWPEMKGVLMFRLSNGAPRYAFKADPMSIVSGAEALNILTACMMEYGADECMEMEIE